MQRRASLVVPPRLGATAAGLCVAAAIAGPGRADPGSAVTGLYVGDELRCSAFQIADGTLLTAAHCVLGTAGPGLTVRFRGDTRAWPVREAWCDPRFQFAKWPRDVAILKIDPRASSAKLGLCRRDCAPELRRQGLSFIGYGAPIDDYGPRGRQRRELVEPGRIGRDLIWLRTGRPLPCHGDSGAPLVDAKGMVLGVHVGGDPACKSNAWFVRIDAPSLSLLMAVAVDVGRQGARLARCGP